MEKKMQKIGACLLLLSLTAVLMLPGQVRAADRSCTVSIPVETVVTGDSAPAGTEFEVVLEAVDEDAPLPETTSLKIKDSGTDSFGPVTYTLPEDYQYRVYQKKGDARNYTYDETVYTVTVRVLNADEGGLTAEIWAIRDGSQNKAEKIVFENSYKAPADPAKPTVKTGDTEILFGWGVLLAAACVVVLLCRRKFRAL